MWHMNPEIDNLAAKCNESMLIAQAYKLYNQCQTRANHILSYSNNAKGYTLSS